jgi:hypothetical protein
MKQRILAAVLAVATFMIVVIAGELLNSKLHPMPSTIKHNDALAVETWNSTQSSTMWWILLATYFIASIAAGFVLRVVHKDYNRSIPTAVGVALTIVGCINFFSMPHPTWVVALGIFTFLPGVFMGYHFLTKRDQLSK